ncbi:MAG: MFS transporter [Clostridia bacterium]|nr:MFS transporter [Clostridia bacterium]
MLKKDFRLTRFACYSAYFTMSSVFSLPPLLFVTFHDMYGVSYTLLGTLVLANFFTQLAVDLIFTAFSKHFNIPLVVKVMPLITSLGLFIFALSPVLFPNAVFAGLLLGTVIFSVASGLSEVLLSPVIAAMPSDNPQRDMSTLHSLYAFGIFTVVIISTVFFILFGNRNWMFLAMFFAALPIISAALFMASPMPDMFPADSQDGVGGAKRRAIGIALCVACIFFGSCAENTMSSWISGYVENALNISKAIGDIIGLAMFAILLGFARISYAKYGKSIMPVLFIGMVGAVACYLTAGLSNSSTVSLIACVLTGLFTAMLWPGSLIMLEEKFPGCGVTAYALMASGGDLGASFAPQLMGIVVDTVASSELAAELAESGALTAEQVGMKVGMLVTAIFPAIGAVVVVIIHKYFKKNSERELGA